MTDGERLRRADEIVQAALDGGSGELSALLDAECAGDALLRAEVVSLLGYRERAKDFIETPAFALGAGLFAGEGDGDSAPAEGRRFGPYRVVREIGRGGMGAVYLAERADGEFKQEVALKVVRRSFADPELARRFRREREILAPLNHPNIARLLDGGVSEDGEPFLAMEYVEGVRVDDFCDARNLSARARLRLFIEVCRGVAYAHQHLVVHRDIKPSNILVTPDGVPKLLDFGIAKLLVPLQAGEQTRTELRAFTPDYASPEQVAGGQVTTASDVYSLGLLLEDLLRGSRAGRHAPGGWRSRVAGETAATNLPTEGDGREGGAKPPARASLNAELKNIVAMARHEDPARRYASAAQLAEDVQRYLDGLPVRAQKDSFTYRAGKFVRRNKAGVGAAALVLLSLVGGLATALWQARVAARERDRARVEAAKAERINAFLQDILGSSSRKWFTPNPAINRDATVKEALDEASRRAQSELAGQPEVLAAVLFSLGESYKGQGKSDLAEQHLRTALDIRRRVLGPGHQETAINMAALSEILVWSGKFPEAESLAGEAVTIFRRARESGDVNLKWLAIALNDLGISMISRGDAAAGERPLREALEVSANFVEEARASRAVMYSNLSVARGNQGDIDGAIEALEMSVEENRRLPGGAGPEYGTTLGNLASFLIIKGEYARAEPLLRESLEVYRQLEGGRNQFTTWSLVYLADSYYLRGDYRRAREEIDRTIEIQRQVLPEGHIDFARSWTVLGKILTRAGEPARGEGYLRRALALRVKALKPGHWRLAETQGALGENLTAQKRYAEAEAFLVESHANLNASLGGRDPRTQQARRRLAAFYEAWGKPDEAVRFTQP